jgi:hypothetical protein
VLSTSQKARHLSWCYVSIFSFSLTSARTSQRTLTILKISQGEALTHTHYLLRLYEDFKKNLTWVSFGKSSNYEILWKACTFMLFYSDWQLLLFYFKLLSYFKLYYWIIGNGFKKCFLCKSGIVIWPVLHSVSLGFRIKFQEHVYWISTLVRAGNFCSSDLTSNFWLADVKHCNK